MMETDNRFYQFPFSENSSVSRWIIVEIPRDGNCLFRALSYSMYGSEDHHQLVRCKIVNTVMKNWQVYSRDVGCLFNGVLIKDKRDYIKYISKNGSQGGQVELTAAVNVFNIFINIHYPTDGSVRRLGFCSKGKTEVNLVACGDGYFDVLVKKDKRQRRQEMDRLRYEDKKRRKDFESSPVLSEKASERLKNNNITFSVLRKNGDITYQRELNLNRREMPTVDLGHYSPVDQDTSQLDRQNVVLPVQLSPINLETSSGEQQNHLGLPIKDVDLSPVDLEIKQEPDSPEDMWMSSEDPISLPVKDEVDSPGDVADSAKLHSPIKHEPELTIKSESDATVKSESSSTSNLTQSVKLEVKVDDIPLDPEAIEAS